MLGEVSLVFLPIRVAGDVLAINSDRQSRFSIVKLMFPMIKNRFPIYPNHLLPFGAALLLTALVTAGCDKPVASSSTGSAAQTYSGTGPIRAVCTTGMVADMVRRIGGERVAVDQIMGE